MKKSIAIMGFAALFSTSVYAGNPCRQMCRPACCLPSEMYFIQLEGGYSWNSLKGIDINIIGVQDFHSASDKNGLSGRVALGASRKVCDPFYVTGEIGWGYYGNSTLPIRAGAPLAGSEGLPGFDGIHFKSRQNGFDVLAGVAYEQLCYELFLKAGALVQNSQMNINADLSRLTNNGVDGDVSLALNQTEVLPEIKLGGAYHVNRNFAIMASWTHAFGSDAKLEANIDPNNPIGSINLNLKNPSLDTVMLGLQYSFA